MGLARITYGAKTINFTKAPYRLDLKYGRQVIANQSASGFVETLNVRSDIRLDIGFRQFINANATDAALKRNIKQWVSHAQMGGAFNFALDSADMVLTTLSASAAAGATVLSLVSMTGVAVDGIYVVRNALNHDVVKVTALDTPGAGQVTIADAINFSYFLGDRFRSEYYFPARLASADNPAYDPIVERQPLWYDVELPLVEDVNGL